MVQVQAAEESADWRAGRPSLAHQRVVADKIVPRQAGSVKHSCAGMTCFLLCDVKPSQTWPLRVEQRRHLRP